MKMNLLSKEGNLAHIECEGAITPDSDPSISTAFEKNLGVGCYGYKVLLNMEKVTYVNSAGVGWLVGCHKDFNGAGGKLVLFAIPPMVNHVLQLLHMHKYLNNAVDEEGAMKLLTGENP